MGVLHSPVSQRRNVGGKIMGNKITTGNLPAKGPGRPKGSLNKTTATAKSIIEGAADKLGGMERMVKWAKEDPANERAFWATIYPKVIPLQVNGPADDGAFVFRVKFD